MQKKLSNEKNWKTATGILTLLLIMFSGSELFFFIIKLPPLARRSPDHGMRCACSNSMYLHHSAQHIRLQHVSIVTHTICLGWPTLQIPSNLPFQQIKTQTLVVHHCEQTVCINFATDTHQPPHSQFLQRAGENTGARTLGLEHWG